MPLSNPARGRCLAAALALAAVLAACSKPDEGPPPKAPPTVNGDTVGFPDQKDPPGVRLVAVGGPHEQLLSLPGRLVWDEDRTTRVYAPYAGRIERLRVAVGDAVRRGQPLADLVSADIGQAQADLQKALADQAVARAAHERAKDLADAEVIARKDLQQAEADLARSNAEAARARARLAAYGVSAGGVTQALTLTAQVAGVVVERNGNPGAEVRPDVQGPPLFTISDPTSLWAVLDVAETQLALLQPGQRIELQTAAWPDERFEATVVHVGEALDPASRTVKVRARVPNAKRRLKAEMFVGALLHRPTGELVVPADAVFLREDKTCVFVQRAPGRYERRVIGVRSAGPDAWQVTAGLAAGERVVVGGALFLNQLLDAAR